MTDTHDLTSLGLTAELATAFEPYAAEGLYLGRVGVQHRGGYVLFTRGGDLPATVSGTMRREPGALPAVGDWVAYELLPEGKGLVRAVLPRATKFSRARRDMNETERAASEQVIAANVDVVFVVTALVDDFDVHRIERYLAAVWEGGAQPVLVLTKSDLCDDVAGRVAEVAAAAGSVPVCVVSSVSGEGLEDVRAHLAGGRTATLVGSSGVGKSTLVNRLLGRDAQLVRALRADGSGRHTTTHRQLFPVPGGGLILDTPGLRVIEPWDGEGLEEAFADVEELAALCRFNDCRHETEPGCAVQAAIGEGRLDPGRLQSLRRLEAEVAFLTRKGDKRLESEERRRWAAVNRERRAEEQLPS